MKLVTYAISTPLGRAERLGAVQGDAVVDLQLAYRGWLLENDAVDMVGIDRMAAALVPTDMTAFLEGGSVSMKAARQALEWAARAPGDTLQDGARVVWPTPQVQLLAPVPRPRTVRDCMAFEQHVTNGYKAIGRTVPEEWYQIPAYYKVAPTSISGPDGVVLCPSQSSWLDFELEYAAVIGRRGSSIKAADAMSHIAGFVIYNDFSARDLQKVEMAVGLGPAKGKDFNTGTVIGPALVTLDEIGDPYCLTMSARLNGTELARGKTGDAHWRWDTIIEFISRDETLLPGDIIGSGTLGGGCLLEQGLPPLKAGDVVELEVEKIGILKTTVSVG
ncbi:fumarylacetoacetate hydrolase family protein [Mesorhizobium sp. CA8]|uniref:fumarylacetoacetate hydrolase family protein n=1 Tax=unclassified Mesorhizobium TaxID=325217 RepID=UPI001CCF415B|nr:MULTISPECIES: fumarylacetoacetate hydrolase family protein [unclassified Mesorhizobium]MBZ9765052.1 fumarylacetoacetate hydrolase family protein [Mesorhizobium sp. CA8]MBZ9823486.1 fumarylacetoacetate hydrolase family protein [Mesorhizobium sp. CA4]